MKRLVWIIFVLVLSACDKQGGQGDAEEHAADRGPLLAEVNGKKIHRQDLDATLVDMFGEYQASMLDEAGRKKALESLVASKALTDMALKKMDRDTLRSIELKTERHRENLIINAYVKENIAPEPVSEKMVEDYYQAHLDKFGQKKLRQYELLSTGSVLTDPLRDKLLAAFEKAKNNKPEAIQKLLKTKGFDIGYHKGVSGEKTLPPRLRDFIDGQPLNKLSSITFIDGKAYAVLVNKEITQPAKPLSEVSREIRKSLAVMQLKKAIKSLSEQALQQAKVNYR